MYDHLTNRTRNVFSKTLIFLIFFYRLEKRPSRLLRFTQRAKSSQKYFLSVWATPFTAKTLRDFSLFFSNFIEQWI
jgi:hypothetical protein